MKRVVTRAMTAILLHRTAHSQTVTCHIKRIAKGIKKINMERTVIVGYKPLPGKGTELKNLMKNHWRP